MVNANGQKWSKVVKRRPNVSNRAPAPRPARTKNKSTVAKKWSKPLGKNWLECGGSVGLLGIGTGRTGPVGFGRMTTI